MADLNNPWLAHWYGYAVPQPLGERTLPDVRPREMRTEPLGQSNFVDVLLSSFGQPSLEALKRGYEGRATPQEIARTFLETGPMGPLGMVRSRPEIALANRYQSAPLDDVTAASGRRLGDLFEWNSAGVPIIPWSTRDEAFANSLVRAPDGAPLGWHLVGDRLVYKPIGFHGGETSSLPRDMREMALRDIDRVLTPRYDHFYRATNRRDEPELVARGVIRPSRNHAEGRTEAGLSVARGPEYVAMAGYPYGYKIRGREIGVGSDGEPLLDVAGGLEVLSPVRRPHRLIQEDVTQRRRLHRQHGFDRLQTRGLPDFEVPFEWFAP